MELKGLDALNSALKNRFRKYPSKKDERFIEDIIFPKIDPKFTFTLPLKIFPIGSCFVRNIEDILSSFENIYMPTIKFKVPKEEWAFRPNGLLNEYTPGCIYQRVLNAFGRLNFDNFGIIELEHGYIDLLLPGGAPPVNLHRVIERRKQIEKIYEELKDVDLVIITLGYIESWLDTSVSLFLNRMPEPKEIRKYPEKYKFKRLKLFEIIQLLEKVINLLSDKKILLTVSPVPLQSTFVPNTDCILSNCYSKSVLRVASEYLYRKYENVDYFPSYEIVLSVGKDAFMPDNVHVKEKLVRKIVDIFLKNYIKFKV